MEVAAPPAPDELPAPLANAALKTPCSSVAWALVNFPLVTSPAIRSSILDFRSPGGKFAPLAEAPAPLLWSEELMSFSAEESAA